MRHFISTLLFIATCSASLAQGQAYFNTNGIAANGYDVVAYFKSNEPVKGTAQFAITWEGVEWRFSNKENLEAFKQNPMQFVPQFGGYCAYGVSENHKAPTDPKAFTVVDHKLYLNYNLAVKEKWSKDTKGYIMKADQNWPGLKSKD